LEIETGSVDFSGSTNYTIKSRAIDRLDQREADTSTINNEISIGVNMTPNAPSSLGPSGYAGINNGSITSDTTPLLQFEISDPNTWENIAYQLQVARSPYYDFSNTVLNITKAPNGSYPHNSTISFDDTDYAGITLPGDLYNPGVYFWRVRTVDSFGTFSDWTNATQGNTPAFFVDTSKPYTLPQYPIHGYNEFQ
jgi:hypothetical protein